MFAVLDLVLGLVLHRMYAVTHLASLLLSVGVTPEIITASRVVCAGPHGVATRRWPTAGMKLI